MTVRGSHRRCLVRAVGGACLAFVFLAAAESDAAETRGYVISMVHTATYADTDHCPMGGNGGPVELRTRRLIGAGYSESEAREIMLNGGRDNEGNRVEAMQLFGSFGGQGWGGLEVNPGNAPYLLPDPHIETAQGRFAPGFNLDGRVDADDFEDPETHERGVDNGAWQVIGCFETFHVRKPVRAYNENITWMRPETIGARRMGVFSVGRSLRVGVHASWDVRLCGQFSRRTQMSTSPKLSRCKQTRTRGTTLIESKPRHLRGWNLLPVYNRQGMEERWQSGDFPTRPILRPLVGERRP